MPSSLTHPPLSLLQTFACKDTLPLVPDQVWQLEQGIVRTLTWDSEGHITTLGIWGRGDVVGLPLTQLSPYQMECLTPVAVTEIPLGSQSRYWQEALLNHLCRSQELFSIVQNPSISAGLLNLLYWLATRFGREIADGWMLKPILTHKQLAEVIGSSRVTVTRILTRLEEEGRLLRIRKRQGYGSHSVAAAGPSRAILLPKLETKGGY
ncbi:MAG: Crp/Fnr family transcriptional regulator [Nodosilinea sp.]